MSPAALLSCCVLSTSFQVKLKSCVAHLELVILTAWIQDDLERAVNSTGTRDRVWQARHSDTTVEGKLTLRLYKQLVSTQGLVPPLILCPWHLTAFTQVQALASPTSPHLTTPLTTPQDKEEVSP